MKAKVFFPIVVTSIGFLLVGFALVVTRPGQAASGALVVDRRILAAGSPPTGSGIIRATTVETVTTFILSNEAPGHLVDYLIAQGHGNDTLLQVLDYLRGQLDGGIVDTFYSQVVSAPAGSEVFIATLSNYAGLVGGIEIGADGTISIPNVEGQDYNGVSGYMTVSSQNRQFNFTYAQDVVYYIYTHTNEYGGGVVRNYYAYGIAWCDGGWVFLPLVVRQ